MARMANPSATQRSAAQIFRARPRWLHCHHRDGCTVTIRVIKVVRPRNALLHKWPEPPGNDVADELRLVDDQLAQHKVDHERLLDEIRDIMDDFDDHETASAQLGARLEAWFSRHFETHDACLHKSLGAHPQ